MNIKSIIKRILGDKNAKNYKYVAEVGMVIDHHDQTHLAVSKLPTVQIFGHEVNGIDGITIPEFGTQDKIASYPGMLDEARVGLTQIFLDGISLPAIIRVCNYIWWLNTQGENGYRVFRDCYLAFKTK